jgi:hypothetical protein
MDQVFMSPMNGQLCVGIPLFRHHTQSKYTEGNHFGLEIPFTVLLCASEPLAYILDCGEWAQVVSAEWVRKNLINLGEL